MGQFEDRGEGIALHGGHLDFVSFGLQFFWLFYIDFLVIGQHLVGRVFFPRIVGLSSFSAGYILFFAPKSGAMLHFPLLHQVGIMLDESF